ncbi:MAG: endolytic transglycosylase MltG [Lachnospiraceae bacterium]|nr:endolytic transglycosylase MltG [Lachnospiraceae bacterium]MDE6420307.1 endolytic transglycosylase MltG [Lachnospiraceae bacterium]
MDVKQIIRGIAALVIKVAVMVLVVFFIYRLALSAYTFGYRIFAEEPMTQGEGVTVSVAVTEEDDVRSLGQKLYDKGLIRSTRLFYFQELLSNYHGIEQPGVYELNTSMTVEEMLEKISEGMPERN